MLQAQSLPEISGVLPLGLTAHALAHFAHLRRCPTASRSTASKGWGCPTPIHAPIALPLILRDDAVIIENAEGTTTENASSRPPDEALYSNKYQIKRRRKAPFNIHPEPGGKSCRAMR
jgi:hypothetical protein